MPDSVLPQPGNPIAAVTHACPYPYYRQLREQRPLYFDEGLKLWVASSHAVIDEAFRGVALRVRPPAAPVPHALLGSAAGEVFAQLVRMNDGAFHAAHKPAPDGLLRALADLRVAPARALHVGDDGADREAAATAGMWFAPTPVPEATAAIR